MLPITILCIGSVWPEPRSSAAGSRTLGLLRFFCAQNWQVIFASPSEPGENAADLELIGVQTKRIALNHASFDTYIAELNPSMVVFDRFMMEEQFGWRVAEFAPHAMRVLDTIDLHCLRLARQKAFKEKREIELNDFHSDSAKRELASIFRSDLSLMISEFEMQWLIETIQINPALLHYHPLTALATEPSERLVYPPFENRQGFVTIGNFRHEPNWDSVLYLKQTLWPLLRKRMPQAQLKIYGSYLTPKVKQLHAPKEGFHVMGRADDALTVMAESRVCLAPLRFGAGVKGKLFDAMVCGTPSVTTAIGAEGMHGKLPWAGHIADTPEAMVDAAIELHENQVAWLAAQKHGWTILADRHSEPVFSKHLLDKISERLKNLSEYRNRNWMGSILMHHSLQSTKYMARWIEAKNKPLT